MLYTYERAERPRLSRPSAKGITMAYKKSGETRDRIIAAAAKLFTERGYYETGIGDIARASFDYHFEDKEKAARALFDSYVDRIYRAADALAPVPPLGDGPMTDPEAFILNTFIKYILVFRYIALNEATHAVYYDLVDFSSYDGANMERLKRTTYRGTIALAAAYGRRMTEPGLVGFIVTTNVVAKSIFKAIQNGTLSFSLEEAMDFFCAHAVLPDIPVPPDRYRALLDRAFSLCRGVTLD
jgi:AcrR family transcriptional regulator